MCHSDKKHKFLEISSTDIPSCLQYRLSMLYVSLTVDDTQYFIKKLRISVVIGLLDV